MNTYKYLLFRAIILLLFSMPVKAQEENAETMEFGFNVRGGSYHGIFLSTAYSYKNFLLELRFGGYSQDSEEVPADYTSGLCVLGFCSPRNKLGTVALLAGWQVPVKTNNKVVFSLKTGVGYNYFRIPENFTKPGTWLGPNYHYDTTHHKNMGWIISLQMAFNLTKHTEVYFAPEMNINSYKNLYNYNFGIRFNVGVAIVSPKTQ